MTRLSIVTLCLLRSARGLTMASSLALSIVEAPEGAVAHVRARAAGASIDRCLDKPASRKVLPARPLDCCSLKS